MSITFEQAAARLSAEAKALFREMAGMHSRATGDRSFLESRTNRGTLLIFTGAGERGTIRDVDGAALEDLARFGLVHVSRPGRNRKFAVGSDGQRFHQYLLEQEGSAPSQVEDELTRVVLGDEFSREHSSAAHHLREAFGLLWSGNTDPSSVSEIGDHLRKALFDLVDDIVGDDDGSPEQPIERLTKWLGDRSLHEREQRVLAALLELTRTTLRLDHRLNHVRDELGKGEPAPTWEEVRRAAFATAFTCYELSR